MKLDILDPCHNKYLVCYLLISNLSASPLLSIAKIFEIVGSYDDLIY